MGNLPSQCANPFPVAELGVELGASIYMNNDLGATACR
jgi:hypothetical protein